MTPVVAATRGKGHFDPDALALHLMHAAATARAMPPAWDGCRSSIPYMSPNGGMMGRMLPGRGLYLFDDLKNLGISRRVPGVLERSPVQRLVDRFAGGKRVLHIDPVRRSLGRAAKISYDERLGIIDAERGAISAWDGVINARASAKLSDWLGSLLSITTVANNWSCLFRAGGSPGTGAYTNIPSGAVLTRADAGAWTVGIQNPTGSDKSYLLTFGYSAAQQINGLLLVDQLVGAGNINANINTSQTVNSTAITRNWTPLAPAALGQIILVVTTALGATGSNFTASSYTDQDGNTAQTTAAIAMTGSAIVERLQPVQLAPIIGLAAGDYGVRSVETVIFSAAMGAGVVALVIFWPIAYYPGVAANTYMETPPSAFSYFTEIVNASGVIGCLTAFALTNTTSTGVFNFKLQTCTG